MVEALTVASKRGDVAGVERYERRATPRGDISLIDLREHNRLRTQWGLAAQVRLFRMSGGTGVFLIYLGQSFIEEQFMRLCQPPGSCLGLLPATKASSGVPGLFDAFGSLPPVAWAAFFAK